MPAGSAGRSEPHAIHARPAAAATDLDRGPCRRSRGSGGGGSRGERVNEQLGVDHGDHAVHLAISVAVTQLPGHVALAPEHVALCPI
jgi:hypothetical protein